MYVFVLIFIRCFHLLVWSRSGMWDANEHPYSQQMGPLLLPYTLYAFSLFHILWLSSCLHFSFTSFLLLFLPNFRSNYSKPYLMRGLKGDERKICKIETINWEGESGVCEMEFRKGEGGMIEYWGGKIGSPHPLLSPSVISHSPSLGWPYLVMLLRL